MTTIRAKVRRLPARGFNDLTGPVPWLAVAYVEGDRTRFRSAWYPTATAAIDAALKFRADLDAELMEEVHASRSSRRVPRCVECGDPVPAGKAHWKINEGPCMILDADTIDPDTAEATR